MNLKDFNPVPPEAHPKLPKELWEVLSPIQTQVRDITNLLKGRVGLDNLNQEVVEGKVVPGTETVFNLKKLKAPPKGGAPILIDSASALTNFRMRIIDESKVGITITLDPAVTSEVTARVLLIGA